ncbi:amidohydrolase [Zooshikella marina]|uniref:amidohydrolase n=1 Tax=Zooshikella ganghwensis TaxID=202772 RepID=UPI001BAE9322|nr:amidohydrolase [Zooshikella ganghwensis]MBU2707053.1 amidohydrolase [Zooshikella ganghwensis]
MIINKVFKYTLSLVCGWLLTCTLSYASEWLIYNVQGYTLTTQHQLKTFSALHVSDDKVKATYQKANQWQQLPASVTRVNGQGYVVLPGLTDAHGHVLGLGYKKQNIDLTASRSKHAALQKIKQFAAEHPKQQWLIGRGWNQMRWQPQAYPQAKDLDLVIRDRPVWLRRVDGHAAWANSKAMEIAGIDANTPDPEGGQILRNEKGKPTGIFIDRAMDLVRAHIPEAQPSDQQQLLKNTLLQLAKLGITSVHDAGVSGETLSLYQQLAQQHQLPIRVYAMLSASAEDYLQWLPKAPIFTADHMFTWRSIKLMLDGALGSRGAALYKDYADAPKQQGLLHYSLEQAVKKVQLAYQQGLQINTHAIGDRGNGTAIKLYQRLAKANIKPLNAEQPGRHRIEHAQIVAPKDMDHFSQLHLIASVQPTHATSDRDMAEQRLGVDRLDGAYAWQRLKQHGIILTGGSDFPVEPANPFYGLHAAVTRQDRTLKPRASWLPSQRLNREDALALFTVNAAYAAFQEEVLGTLEPGKYADFIIIDRDLFNIPDNSIWQTQVMATFVAGKRVWPKQDPFQLKAGVSKQSN